MEKNQSIDLLKLNSAGVKIPGKTFLVGEYVATTNGPSLIFTSEPKFSFTGTVTSSIQEAPFHPDSPAGKFYQLYETELQNHSFKFSNPYNKGGLGASTAEFLALYLYTKNLLNIQTLTNESFVKLYQSLSITKGTPPSGADLIAQLYQGISFYHPNINIQQSYIWPFENLSLLLFHSNKKLATHEHLQNLNSSLNFNNLTRISLLTSQAFIKADQNEFINGINLYAKELKELNLVAKHSQLILKTITEKYSEILAAKGCGALGADVFMLLCHPNHKKQLIKLITQQGYPLMATEQQLSNHRL